MNKSPENSNQNQAFNQADHGHESSEHDLGLLHEATCHVHGAGEAPMCSCDHNPGGECHCPPNECKCDQQHHRKHETQHGHNCCATDGEHDHAAGGDHSMHADHDMHAMHMGMDHSMHGGHDHSGHAGHDHSHHDPKMFARQFWFALALTIPTILYSHTLQMMLGFSMPTFPYSNFVPAIAGTILFFTGGLVFLKTGWQELRAKKPGMMALIAMALVVAFGYSAILSVFDAIGKPLMSMGGMDFWWELASLVTIMLLGHWIEMSSVMAAQASMNSLAALIPDEAIRVSGETSEKIKVSELRVGDLVLVKPGASVPADGVVIDGTSKLNEALVTGESADVTKQVGDHVIAGTINSSGRAKSIGALTVRITATGTDTMISGIMRLVADAQSSKSRGQILADRAAGWLFYFALVAALITAAVWSLIGSHDLTWTIERVVTVLVIACPHALGLAIPLVTAITTERAAKAGIIVRNRLDFEKARNVKMVMFDKTGTLTTGKRTLLATHLTKNSTLSKPEDLIRLAAAVEQNSEHIIGAAIIAEAKRLELPPVKADSFEAHPGRGVSAMVKGRLVEVGSPSLLVERRGEIDVNDLVAVQAANDGGNTVIFVLVDHHLEGYFEFGDELREGSAAAVRELQRRGIRVGMVTGDAHGVANALAQSLGITDVYAEVLPGQKSELVRQRQAEGMTVAFVGDGINDAPALAQADVAFAIAAGTDVAFETSGLVLVNSDPNAVVSAIDLSKRSVSKMRQNLFWGAGYNIVAVPIAAGVLDSLGVELSPAVGAVLMSLSTIIVAANAQLLRR